MYWKGKAVGFLVTLTTMSEAEFCLSQVGSGLPLPAGLSDEKGRGNKVLFLEAEGRSNVLVRTGNGREGLASVWLIGDGSIVVEGLFHGLNQRLMRKRLGKKRNLLTSQPFLGYESAGMA